MYFAVSEGDSYCSATRDRGTISAAQVLQFHVRVKWVRVGKR